MHRTRLTHHNVDQIAAEAVEYLQEGGIVLLPTDTAYALAADATDGRAVDAVFRLKGRPRTKTSSVVVGDREQAEALAGFNTAATVLWELFMPGPLTLVLPVRGDDLAAHVTGEGRTVGLRHPDHAFACAVAERLGHPYTATSANRAGHPPAYDPDEFLRTIPDERMKPHLVIDAGMLPMVPVSTVVSVGKTVKVLREGAIPGTAIMEAVGQPNGT